MLVDLDKALAALKNLPEAAPPPSAASGAVLDLFRLTDFEIEKTCDRTSSVISGFSLPSGVQIKSIHARSGSVRKNGSQGYQYTPPSDRSIIFDIVAADCTDGLIRADFFQIRK